MSWRVSELTAEQEDLSLFCFALLSSEVRFPLTFGMRQGRRRRELWLETQLMGPAGTSTEDSIRSVFQ